MRNNRLTSIAKETVSIGDAGFYNINSRQKIEIKEEIYDMIENTRVIKGEPCSDILAYTRNNLEMSNVLVTERTTNEAIEHWYGTEGVSKIIILNFASAKNPGGGFLKGSRAQEEQLCYRSLLYKSLVTKMKEFYEVGRENPRDGLYHNLAIYSKKVPFIRNEALELIEPMFVDVITCPAVNRGVAEKNRIANTTILVEMYNRCNLVMDTILENLEDSAVVILGAFGCGVFKNNPSQVADIFKVLIGKHKQILVDRNITIEFAIPKGPNLDEFKRVIR